MPTTATASEQATDTQSAPAQPPRAYLELKTFDPGTGACLKYKTDKAAEVGRLIATLGTLGRDMAALPELPQGVLMLPLCLCEEGLTKLDVAMPDAPASGQETPLPEQNSTEQKPAAGKKKKKGKK